MTKYAYEYGKRWHVETPRAMLKRFVERQHVGRDISDIHADIIVAIEKSKDKARFTRAVRQECLRYAAVCHDRNRDLYRRVMSGRLLRISPRTDLQNTNGGQKNSIARPASIVEP